MQTVEQYEQKVYDLFQEIFDNEVQEYEAMMSEIESVEEAIKLYESLDEGY